MADFSLVFTLQVISGVHKQYKLRPYSTKETVKTKSRKYEKKTECFRIFFWIEFFLRVAGCGSAPFEKNECNWRDIYIYLYIYICTSFVAYQRLVSSCLYIYIHLIFLSPMHNFMHRHLKVYIYIYMYMHEIMHWAKEYHIICIYISMLSGCAIKP